MGALMIHEGTIEIAMVALPGDQQTNSFQETRQQPTTAINGCLPNLGETKWKVEKLSHSERQYKSTTDGISAGFVRLPEWMVPLGVWKMNAVNDFGGYHSTTISGNNYPSQRHSHSKKKT